MKKDVEYLLLLGALSLLGLSRAEAQVSAPPALVSIIPQIVDGGVWATTIVLTNTSPNPTNVSLSFYQGSGSGNTQRWDLAFVEVAYTQTGSVSLPAGSSLFLHTPGTAANATVGWGQVAEPYGSGTPVVVAYAVFIQEIPGQSDQAGSAQATVASARFLVPFDNTNGR